MTRGQTSTHPNTHIHTRSLAQPLKNLTLTPDCLLSQVLEGLDPVRKRPGMYIGSTGPRGLHHLLWEVLDNAVDEVQGGWGNEVTVTVDLATNEVTITDNGR